MTRFASTGVLGHFMQSRYRVTLTFLIGPQSYDALFQLHTPTLVMSKYPVLPCYAA